MNNEARKVVDPLGNTVVILPGTGMGGKALQDPDIFDDIPTVIQRPAMMIDVREPERALYYFRSIGWNSTILLATRQLDDHWEIFECIKNPPNETLSDLMRKGTQVL